MRTDTTGSPPRDLVLRDVVPADLPVFFAQHLDADANYMAAFTAKDPSDWDSFIAHWDRILADPTTHNQTIVVTGAVVGSVSSYETDGAPEVTYRIGKDYWGQGIATRALATFLAQRDTRRPMYARAAKDNVRSLRVLHNCGFRIMGEDRGFANARGQEIDEYLSLRARFQCLAHGYFREFHPAQPLGYLVDGKDQHEAYEDI